MLLMMVVGVFILRFKDERLQFLVALGWAALAWAGLGCLRFGADFIGFGANVAYRNVQKGYGARKATVTAW